MVLWSNSAILFLGGMKEVIVLGGIKALGDMLKFYKALLYQKKLRGAHTVGCTKDYFSRMHIKWSLPTFDTFIFLHYRTCINFVSPTLEYF